MMTLAQPTRRSLARMALIAMVVVFSVASALAQTDAEKQRRVQEQALADILAGRTLPPIEPIPARVYPNEILLYSDAEIKAPDEQWEKYAGSPIVRNIVRPTLTPFLPDPAKATGAAVIIAPGGAFMYLGMEGAEGAELAHWLADRGVAAFILKYRVDPTPRGSQDFLKKLFQLLGKRTAERSTGDADPVLEVPDVALEDGKAAVRLVRTRAAEWHVDPTRIGFIGFSAGAFLTLHVGLGADADARPDFIGVFYGPTITAAAPPYAPPMFLAAALDDPLFNAGANNVLATWTKAKRPIEAHFYEHGGHGFAKGTTAELWKDQFYAWIERRGLLNAAK